jgi:hypothetical protein
VGALDAIEERLVAPPPRPAPALEPTPEPTPVAVETPPRRKRGWPGPGPGPGRPRKLPKAGAFEQRLAQVRAAAQTSEPEPEVLPTPLTVWLARTVPGPGGTRREPTLLEAWLARHPEASDEMWAGVRPPEPASAQEEADDLRPRRKVKPCRARRPRECECGQPSIKLTGADFRCQRCRDMEASQFHLGDTDELMLKAYDPRWRAAGYVDRNRYKASPAVIPNLSPDAFENPGLRQWLRKVGRLHASEIRQIPYGSGDRSTRVLE